MGSKLVTWRLDYTYSNRKITVSCELKWQYLALFSVNLSVLVFVSAAAASAGAGEPWRHTPARRIRGQYCQVRRLHLFTQVRLLSEFTTNQSFW